MKTKLKQSSGGFGESLALLWYQQHGWKMFRSQPATRWIAEGGKWKLIQKVDDSGIADYTGYVVITPWSRGSTVSHPYYCAVEVKEAHGCSMPASRLAVHQRRFMESLPPECAFVCVVWVDGMPEAEMFPYQSKGSYQKGKGAK